LSGALFPYLGVRKIRGASICPNFFLVPIFSEGAMQHSRAKLVFFLLFRPSRFINLSQEQIAWMNTEEGMKVKTQANAIPYPVSATAAIRRALALSFVYVTLSVAFGVIVGRALVALTCVEPLLASEIFQYVGIAILLWATLGKVGWNVQTMNGNTYPETVNELVYRVLYILGSFALALSASLAFGANGT
ncbi:MAG: hypothetical protein AABZ84_04830, partial [Pseudomonadota bacterium]